jgi:hypothetical protein
MELCGHSLFYEVTLEIQRKHPEIGQEFKQ